MGLVPRISRQEHLNYSEMLRQTIIWSAVVCTIVLSSATGAEAQLVEAVGERALGMGGAFVAVASDSSATWWNPAALADGPFFDLTLGRTTDGRHFDVPAARDGLSGFALSTPVVGATFYRLGITGASAAVAQVPGDRQDGKAPLGLRSWSASVAGGTLVQTLVDGVHVGTTLKYVRGRVRTGVADSANGLESALDAAGDLDGGRAENRFDLDVGVLALAGPVRVGLLVRNVRAPEFGDGAFRLPRQSRVGAAFSAEQIGGAALTLAVDADLQSYLTSGGERRVIAVGAEQWLAGKRLGIRGGARFNQVGHAERALTAGASVALRPGSYLEAHVVGGGSPAERGWGTGIHVSF